MENLLAVFIAALIGIPFVLFVVAFGSIVRGYVLHVLWGWFMVEQFHLPQLSIVAAIGLSLTLNYLLPHATNIKANKTDEKKTLSETVGELVGILISPFVTLLFGWALHRFFM